MHLQEEVGQRLSVSAWILPHFPSEYGTFLPLIKVESIYQHYALRLFLIIWTSAETSILFFFFSNLPFFLAFRYDAHYKGIGLFPGKVTLKCN